MEALTVAIALSFLFADPDFGYSAKADRLRFPPDEVLRDWQTANCKRRAELNDLRASVSLVTNRPALRELLAEDIDAEIGELERIANIIMWMMGCDYNSEWIVRVWMKNARAQMTEDEYLRGYVSWGGLAR